MGHPTEEDLMQRLARLEVTYDPRAVDRTIAAGEQAGGSRRRRRRGMIAGAALAGVAALLVSPAGGALAGAIGDVVGIGDQPSRSDQIDPDAAFPPARDQRVIAMGLTPDGREYELIATASRYDVPLAAGEQVGLCVDIDVPAEVASSRRTYQPVSCFGRDAEKAVAAGTSILEARSASPELAPAAALTVSGWLPPDVTSVDISYEDGAGATQPAVVSLGRVEGELTEKVGAPSGLGFFSALIPAEAFRPTASADGLLDRCEVSAALDGITGTLEDSSGQVITLRPDRRYEVAIVSSPPKPFGRPLGRDDTALEVTRLGRCQN